METVTIRAEFSDFKRKLDWISLRLEAGDVRERLDSSLLSRLYDASTGVGSEEIAKISNIPTRSANELIVGIDDGPIIVELEAALRTLGFEFHDVTPTSGFWESVIGSSERVWIERRQQIHTLSPGESESCDHRSESARPA